MKLTSITYKLVPQKKHRKLFQRLLSALTLQGSNRFKTIGGVNSIFFTGSFDGLIVRKNMLLDSPAINKELGHELALLRKVFDNPLLPFDSAISLISRSDAPSSLTYICESIVPDPPSDVAVTVTHPLAILPALLKSNRIGLSLGIACCQSIVALERMKPGQVEAVDLAVAVASVLIDMARSATTSPTQRYLTSARWTDLISDRSPSEIMAIANEISLWKEKSIDSFLLRLKTEYEQVNSVIFGRIRSCLMESDRNDGGFHFQSVVAALSEQMNLFDFYHVIDKRIPLKILYTPLTLYTRLLLETLIDVLCNKHNNVEFQFHVGLLPVMANVLLDKVIDSSKKPVLYISGGGQLNYLISFSLEKKYRDDIIVRTRPCPS
ncbi:MAG: hypothetical protein K9W43_04265 [Candidatus Thorarchaeota archaeon]|nr:hypothetical protein [Candidatus Thorarchaeota archaeon]